MSGLTTEELRVWCQYIHSVTGIFLDESKAYLIEGRLNTLLRETGSTNFSELYFRVRSEKGNRLRQQVIDAITTGETSFFRDQAPFHLLQEKLLPELIERRRSQHGGVIPIRIWSAACSTGQELYSIAMTLVQRLGHRSEYDIRLLGTDISDQAVAAASRGVYSKLEIVRGLNPSLMSQFFTVEGSTWKIKDEIRAMANFRVQNLLESFLLPYRFDIVFCRNVAIYFKDAERSLLFNHIASNMARDGVLILGSTESLTGLVSPFQPRRYQRTVYYEWAERPDKS